MTQKLQFKRALLLLAFLGAAFAGLGYRLVDLQVLRHDDLLKLAKRNTAREFWQAPRRGDILDANGNVLATSVSVKTICADPTLIGNQQAVVAQALAPLLNLDSTTLFQKLLPRQVISKNEKGETVTNISHYVRLEKNVSDEVWQKIQAAMTNLSFAVDENKLSKTNRAFFRDLRQSAIFVEPDQMRIYPNGPLAAQVIGFPAIKETNVNGHFVSKIVGCDGIEYSMDKSLSGVAGWRMTQTDRAQHELVALRDEDVTARDGLNVVLTIDAAVQHIVETSLADAMQKHTPKSITGIVMRPSTGEILAMASLPNYDPNKPSTITSNTEPNLCIGSVIEPGSTFKTIVIAGALDTGRANLNTEVFCENGFFNFAGLHLHDSEGHHFGNLPIWQVLQKSSNIGAVKVAMLLGSDSLHDYMTAFGLGTLSGISLPHEANTARLVPTAQAFNKNKFLIAQVPMGQGVAVTRLQMTMVISALANNGVLMRPMLVKNLQDSDGNIFQSYQPQAVRSVVRPETARQMVEAMKTVVLDGGTAKKAAMTNYVVAGKTGTAQKIVGGHYSTDRYVVSFIGFFPADNPQLCISVVMDEPKEGGKAFGGDLCGPVFKDIAERCASYLNIRPDENAEATNAPTVASARTQNNF
jgi:cell division protein FtsI/penicillin-binding protein 2